MSTKKGLMDACCGIGIVILLAAAIFSATYVIALRAYPGAEAVTVNAPVAATADDVAMAAAVENSLYGHGYGRGDYMASSNIDKSDYANWYFGEGAQADEEPLR